MVTDTHPVSRTLLAPLRILLDLVLPQRCAGCGAPDSWWCAHCGGTLSLFAVERNATTPGPPVFAAGRYLGSARRAVIAYKERGRRGLAVPIGQALATVLPDLPGIRAGPDGTVWLVPVPSSGRAARRRGGQHMAVVARECARALAGAGLPAGVAPALRVSGRVRDSVGLGPQARAENLRGRIRVRPDAAPPAGVPVVVLDDVITTGATAAACTRALEGAGIPVAAVLAFTATG